MILPSQEIRKLKPIEPFHERTTVDGMTFGLGPAGYDVRIAEDLWIKEHGFQLASTIERFNMPKDILAQVCDKSTWARQGLAVQNTIIEPGWQGYLTLELTNNLPYRAIHIKAGAPIAQIIFMRLTEPTEAPYDGKYNHQRQGPQDAILE